MAIEVIQRRIQLCTNDIIAVCEDTNTNQLVFSIPLSSSSYALNTLTPFILYRPHGVNGMRFKLLENKTVSNGNLLLTWNIDRNSTLYAGKLQIQIVLSSHTTDPFASATYRWSTRVRGINIPASLIGEEYAVSSEPVLTQMLALTERAELAAETSQRIFTFKGSSTYAALPNSGNTINDLYTVTDRDNVGYAWNGAGWHVAPIGTERAEPMSDSYIDAIWDSVL